MEAWFWCLSLWTNVCAKSFGKVCQFVKAAFGDWQGFWELSTSSIFNISEGIAPANEQYLGLVGISFQTRIKLKICWSLFLHSKPTTFPSSLNSSSDSTFLILWLFLSHLNLSSPLPILLLQIPIFRDYGLPTNKKVGSTNTEGLWDNMLLITLPKVTLPTLRNSHHVPPFLALNTLSSFSQQDCKH